MILGLNGGELAELVYLKVVWDKISKDRKDF